MKPCRKQNQPAAPASPVRPPSGQRAPAVPETNVRRYVHPIRTAKPPAHSPVEETLSYVLEALARQSEQLDEVLRRLDGDNSETIVNK